MVILQSAGGGGYGDPLEREPEALAQDVADGVVSAESAGTLYRKASGGLTLTVAESDADAYVPSGPSCKRIIRLHPADATACGLAAGNRVELLGEDGAPLRGWLVCDETVPAGSVPLDRKGLLTVGVNQGEQIQIRPLNAPLVGHREG